MAARTEIFRADEFQFSMTRTVVISRTRIQFLICMGMALGIVARGNPPGLYFHANLVI